MQYGTPLSQLVIKTWQDDKVVIGEECLANIGNKAESACGGEAKVIKNTIVKLELLWWVWKVIFKDTGLKSFRKDA